MSGQKSNILCGPRAAELLASADRAELLGVYHAGCYLRFPNGLLLLTDRCRGLVPFGISLPGYASLFAALDGRAVPEVGIGRSAEGTELAFGSLRLPLGLLSPDRRVCRLSRLPARPALAEVARLVTERKPTGFAPLAAALCGLPAPEMPEPHLRRAAALFPSLLEALCAPDLPKLGALVSSLIGLGFGLTPSGDDLLCGALYAAHYFSPALGGEIALRLANAVHSSLSHTNLISRQYLVCAAAGERFDAVADLAEALCGSGGETVRATALRLLSVGSSSGADLAVGFLSLLYQFC